MNDFNNDFSYDVGGFGGYDSAYDSSYDNSYTYEPDPMSDFSIDPLAFVPGAVLDCSKPSWGASLAIQQGVELMAQMTQHVTQEMTESVFEQMHYPEQQAWLQQRYYAGSHTDEREAQIALARAWPIPPRFYSEVCSYADRHNCSVARKQYFRQLDAARAQREYAERHGLGELLEQQDRNLLEKTGRYPVQCYSTMDLYADRPDLSEDDKVFLREYDAPYAWAIIRGRTTPGWRDPRYIEKYNVKYAAKAKEKRQKVFHIKSAVGHVLSNLRVTFRGPSRDDDPVWQKMHRNADMRSMVMAELLEYTGKRGDDSWIRPTLWELLKMDFWTAHRYAFYYAEFNEEYGRKIPLWIALILRSRKAYAPSYTPSAVMFSNCAAARMDATASA